MLEKYEAKESVAEAIDFYKLNTIVNLIDNIQKFKSEKLKMLLYNAFFNYYSAIRTSEYSVSFLKFWNIIEQLLHDIRKEKTIVKRFKLRSVLKYAAVVLLFLGLGYIYQHSLILNEQVSIIIPKEEAITLKMGNGMVEVINTLSSKEIKDYQGNLIGFQSKSNLKYSSESPIKSLIYNSLNVPYGKQFELILSDGTKVFLNAGTSIKYPVKFLNGKNRQVFLNGEAYFEVAKDSQHPFIVNADELRVEVTGTEFNISAYHEDNISDVVLVEGSVALYAQENTLKNSTFLTPGLKGTFNKEQNSICTEKVNTTIYTEWLRGGLVFRNMSFSNIIKKLERHYHITIINNNESLGNEVFNASFHKETINKVLSYFNDSFNIDYTIEKNIIYIN